MVRVCAVHSSHFPSFQLTYIAIEVCARTIELYRALIWYVHVPEVCSHGTCTYHRAI